MQRGLKKFCTIILLICALVGLVAQPSSALAAQTYYSVDACAYDAGFNFSTDYYVPFSAKVVSCIEYLIVSSSSTLMNAISDYMWPTVGAMFVLAIAVFGIRVIGMDRDRGSTIAQGISFSLRMGLVLLFSYNLGGLAGFVFDVENQLIGLVTGGYTPWPIIDTIIGRLLGFGPNIALFAGIMGLLGASLTSSSVGIFIFLAGLTAIIYLLLFIFRVVYVYILAITVIAFLLAISPFIIPLAIFFYTERYFTTWFHMILSAMILPILMFAFLYMFLDIFHTLVDNVFAALGSEYCYNVYSGSSCSCPDTVSYSVSSCVFANPDLQPFWKMNEPIFSWMMPTDPAYADTIQRNAENAGKVVSPVQSNINPLLTRAYDANTVNRPSIDFGYNHIGITQRLVFAFISLWIYATLMKSMLGLLPEIANNMAGAVSGIQMTETNVERTVKRWINSGKSELAKATAGGGGGAGGAGAAAANSSGGMLKNMAGNVKEAATQLFGGKK